MAPQDDVYVISEEDILEPFRKGQGGKKGHFSVATADGTERLSGAATARSTRSRSSGSARPLVASSLSLAICGAGQVYNGQAKLGLLLFLTEIFAVAAHWSALKLWPVLRDLAFVFAITEREMFVFLAVADFLLVFFMLYNVAQAYHHAEAEGARFDGLRSPILSGLASLMVPGWGQLLNAQLGKALFFLFCILTEIYVVSLLMISPFLRILPDLGDGDFLARRATLAGMGVVAVASLMWVLSVYDAFLVARYRQKMA
jgi:TM2 domain-containing membrane protein YozV